MDDEWIAVLQPSDRPMQCGYSPPDYKHGYASFIYRPQHHGHVSPDSTGTNVRRKTYYKYSMLFVIDLSCIVYFTEYIDKYFAFPYV